MVIRTKIIKRLWPGPPKIIPPNPGPPTWTPKPIKPPVIIRKNNRI